MLSNNLNLKIIIKTVSNIFQSGKKYNVSVDVRADEAPSGVFAYLLRSHRPFVAGHLPQKLCFKYFVKKGLMLRYL